MPVDMTTLREALTPAKQVTLRDALRLASAYWDTKGGTTGTVMEMRARKCVELGGLAWDLPVSVLTAREATSVLTGIHHLALSSRATYYAAFKRMVELAGKSTVGWPSAGSVPRRVREPLKGVDLQALRDWLDARSFHETVNLVDVLWGTGMRVEVEALSFGAWGLRQDRIYTDAEGGALHALYIKGKGGHERLVPISIGLGALLTDPRRMNPMRRLSYSAHLKRWNAGVKALGIQSRLPTPHAVRHLYATEAYERSGRNLNVVRELLGHADINTTARYIGVNMEELRHAAGA